uniref:Cyclin N-terminal domain-containing protein n=1 Tax=Schistosoma mansoni TaxID=6183 RepID=A0A5K4F6H1_SCHMA
MEKKYKYQSMDCCTETSSLGLIHSRRKKILKSVKMTGIPCDILYESAIQDIMNNFKLYEYIDYLSIFTFLLSLVVKVTIMLSNRKAFLCFFLRNST